MSNCELCGEPMPQGEEMFNYHGHSGPCPKPPLPAKTDARMEELQAHYNDLLALQDQADTVPLTKALDAVGLALELLGAEQDELDRMTIDEIADAVSRP